MGLTPKYNDLGLGRDMAWYACPWGLLVKSFNWVPRSTSYGVYISQLIRFARVSSHVVDFNARNKSLTAKLLQQGYRYHKLRKTFSKFYRRHHELVSKFNVGLKTLLHQGLSEPQFCGDLVYKFKKNVGTPHHGLIFLISCVVRPVVLFDTPGISRCRSQHVSVESSSLLHHGIYLWFICFTWWSIDELENLHPDRTTVCFEPWLFTLSRICIVIFFLFTYIDEGIIFHFK